MPVAQADFLEQRGQHFQHFGIARGRLAAGGRRTDDLGADLIELAIAALLRALAAELRADVVELLQRALLVEPMLDVGANDAGGVLRTEGQRLRLLALRASLVLPGEHFFGDDVGLFADAAREERRIFEDGSADFVIVVAREEVAHFGLDPIP